MDKPLNQQDFRHRVLKFKIDDQVFTQPDQSSLHQSSMAHSPYSITAQSFFRKNNKNNTTSNNNTSRVFLKPLSPNSYRNSGMSMPSYDQLNSPWNGQSSLGKSQFITLKQKAKEQKLVGELLKQQSRNESFGDDSDSSPLSYENFFSGTRASEKFFNYYKNLSKMKQKLQTSSQSNYQKEFYLKMLEKFDEKQMLPRQLGFVRQISNNNQPIPNNTLQLNHYNLGQYNDVLPDCLNNLKSVEKIECNLSNNQINEIKAKQLFSQLNVSPKIINFAGNSIGVQGTVGLSKLISNPHCKLREVNLERNQITDYQIQSFFSSLTENKSIIKLNLSENALSNASSKMIKEYLIKNETIMELYLH